ncbi:hypothetical protein Q5P01_010735 [Channa striata]|uniref:Uncharacterized protein n=1 Tax=Channa striata TaxID=64152 RepID=A0AA88SNG8_CHASR|nr:hypothetical protein Q5P01_010735 [Channa striata]
MRPSVFPTEESRVAYALSLLSGRAGIWGTSEWERGSWSVLSFESFAEELLRVFGPAKSEQDSSII